MRRWGLKQQQKLPVYIASLRSARHVRSNTSTRCCLKIWTPTYYILSSFEVTWQFWAFWDKPKNQIKLLIPLDWAVTMFFFYFRIAQFKGLFCFDRAWNNILNISKIPRICGSSMVHKPFAQPAAIPIDLFCASCTWVYVARNRLALYLFHVNA